jgi:lysophospholipase L1-like esterase
VKRTEDINDILKPLSATASQAYLSNAVQVADILEWILEQVGTARVWQTSFSISEEFLRRLFFIEKGGRVSEFNLVLDHKATNKTLKLWSFIAQVIQRTYLADNHSKILLVEAASGECVSVITSQNLTRGNRHESAFISTEKQIFDTLKKQVEDLIKNHSVPLHDLFAQRISDIKL